jgi:hypothetical protein
MNTIEINGKVFNEDEIKQLVELVNELLTANDDMRANVIAMSAKLENEELKVKRLIGELYLLQQHKNNYRA